MNLRQSVRDVTNTAEYYVSRSLRMDISVGSGYSITWDPQKADERYTLTALGTVLRSKHRFREIIEELLYHGVIDP